MTTSTSQLQRVTRRNPCPICGNIDYCTVHGQRGIVGCMRRRDGAYRVGQSALGEQYWHRLSNQERDHLKLPPSRPPRPKLPHTHLMRLAKRWHGRAAMVPGDLLQARADYWGVSREVVVRLRIGIARDYELRAMHTRCVWDSYFTAPIFTATLKVCGIALQPPAYNTLPPGGNDDDRKKKMLTGSSPGLYVPAGLNDRKLLLVVEGLSDTAAALHLGFDAIGRFSNGSCADDVADFAERRGYAMVAVIPDNDPSSKPQAQEATRRGLDALMGSLLTRRIDAITLRPSKAKDLRQWLNNGGTRDALLAAIDKTASTRTDNKALPDEHVTSGGKPPAGPSAKQAQSRLSGVPDMLWAGTPSSPAAA